MIFMLRPPLWTQESQRRSRPFIIGPFQCTAHQPLPKSSMLLPHCRVHAVPFQIQFQKAAEDSRFLHRIKHYSTLFTQTGIIVAWRVGFEKRRFSQDSIAKFDTNTYSILRLVVYCSSERGRYMYRVRRLYGLLRPFYWSGAVQPWYWDFRTYHTGGQRLNRSKRHHLR